MSKEDYFLKKLESCIDENDKQAVEFFEDYYDELKLFFLGPLTFVVSIQGLFVSFC